MKTKTHSQSGSRAFLILFCAAASSILAGTLLAFLSPEVPAKVSDRTLTFKERVSYQRAIEEVYWRHRIWPAQQPDPNPSLDAVMTEAQLEQKVADYLRNSQALENEWQRPARNASHNALAGQRSGISATIFLSAVSTGRLFPE
jgi:hypothetical protein